MSLIVGACDTVLPVAAHMPSGASACMSLIEALRSRAVGDEVEVGEVGVRASCGAAPAGDAGALSPSLPAAVMGGGATGVEGACTVVGAGAMVLSPADAVAGEAMCSALNGATRDALIQCDARDADSREQRHVH
jgi:hypothetical protein